MRKGPVVYVVNYAGHDLTDAQKFTNEEFVHITEGFVPFNEQTAYEMAKKLRDFREEDFLILSGSAALAATAVAVLIDTLNIHSINVLLYSAKRNAYFPRRLYGRITLPKEENVKIAR